MNRTRFTPQERLRELFRDAAGHEQHGNVHREADRGLGQNRHGQREHGERERDADRDGTAIATAGARGGRAGEQDDTVSESAHSGAVVAIAAPLALNPGAESEREHDGQARARRGSRQRI